MTRRTTSTKAGAHQSGKLREKPSLPPSRQGKKPITAYVDPQTHKQLRLLGVELGKSNQEMIVEALEDYLGKQADKT